MLTRWEPQESRHQPTQVTTRRLPWQQQETGLMLAQPTTTPPQHPYEHSSASFVGFPSPIECSGNVVYRSSTSRVYSLHGNCAEERRAEQDRRNNTEHISVTRVLDGRSTTYTQHRDLATGKAEMRRSAVNVTEDSHKQFDSDWMRVAERFLPPYNNGSRREQPRIAASSSGPDSRRRNSHSLM